MLIHAMPMVLEGLRACVCRFVGIYLAAEEGYTPWEGGHEHETATPTREATGGVNIISHRVKRYLAQLEDARTATLCLL